MSSAIAEIDRGGSLSSLGSSCCTKHPVPPQHPLIPATSSCFKEGKAISFCFSECSTHEINMIALLPFIFYLKMSLLSSECKTSARQHICYRRPLGVKNKKSTLLNQPVYTKMRMAGAKNSDSESENLNQINSCKKYIARRMHDQ